MAWAVAIWQVGVAVVDFAALRDRDAIDGNGAKYIGIGKVNFAGGNGGEPKSFQEHGAAFSTAVGIEPVAVGVEAPILGNGETVAVIVDTLLDVGAFCGDAGDETSLVAIATGDIEQWEGVAIVSKRGKRGVVAMGCICLKWVSGDDFSLFRVEYDTLPSIAEHDNVVVVDGHSLAAAGKGCAVVHPVA